MTKFMQMRSSRSEGSQPRSLGVAWHMEDQPHCNETKKTHAEVPGLAEYFQKRMASEGSVEPVKELHKINMSGMPLLPLTWNTTYTNFQRSDPHKSWTYSFSSTGFILPFLWIQGAQSSLRSSKDVPDPWAAPVLHPSWSASASFDLHESPVSCSMKDPNLKPTSKKQTMYMNNDCINSI